MSSEDPTESTPAPAAAPDAVPAASIPAPAAAAAPVAPSSFYRAFDTATGNGRVLTSDLSSTFVEIMKLHETEIAERNSWLQTLNTIYAHYINAQRPIAHPIVTSQELILQQRLVAPVLPAGKVSTRSKPQESRKGRLYPITIQEWDRFKESVPTFQGSTVDTLLHTNSYIFSESLIRAKMDQPKKEIYKQNNLLANLREGLVYSGIVHQIVEEEGGIGLMDFNLLAGTVANTSGIARSEEIAVVCESKSTHNLLLPIDASSLVRKYNEAHVAVVDQRQDRTTEWSHIGHPLAQLIGYLADNNRRYGVLTSGTRSYFVHVSGDREGSNVSITDGWFVGEPNYLRAWAFIYSLGCSQDDSWHAPKRWLGTEKRRRTPQKYNDHSGGEGHSPGRGGGSPGKRGRSPGKGGRSTETRKRKAVGSQHSSKTKVVEAISQVIASAPFEEIEILEVIGEGRNGAAFKVCWHGQEVAMKQFDIGRQSEAYFSQEINAYMKLQDVWGVLVPRPVFVSESFTGGRLFLGLQLGRDPEGDDDTSSAPSIIKRLEDEFGIKHNDAAGRNFVFVDDGEGSERLVAIDFEDYEVLWEDEHGDWGQ